MRSVRGRNHRPISPDAGTTGLLPGLFRKDAGSADYDSGSSRRIVKFGLKDRCCGYVFEALLVGLALVTSPCDSIILLAASACCCALCLTITRTARASIPPVL